MNIAYFLYREDIFSPLVESQVMNILYRLSTNGMCVHFIWLKRIDYCFKYSEKIEFVRARLKEHGIILHEIPIIVGKFPLGKSMTDFVYWQASRRVRRILSDNNIDIVHTRGYNAGLFVSRLMNKDLTAKHVFDPRSPYLTEIVSTYSVDIDDLKYSFWRYNEEYIVNNASKTIATSDAFANDLRNYRGDVVVIPNNSEMEKPEIVLERAERQRRNSFCFVGSLGYGWNNVHDYISFMKRIWAIRPDIKLELYVLKQDIVRKELKDANIPSERYIIKTLPQAEVGINISGCLAGLQIMSKPDARLGIKTVDYLSAGVPVICCDNAMGAANIIQKYNVGWNIDRKGINEIINEVLTNSEICKKCAQVAWKEFSTWSISQKYISIYKELIECEK